MEPLFNEVAGERQNSFVKSGVPHIEVIFHIFYYYRVKIIPFVISMFSLNRGSLNRDSTVYSMCVIDKEFEIN